MPPAIIEIFDSQRVAPPLRSPAAEGAGNEDLRYEISDIRCGIPFGDDFEKCVYRLCPAFDKLVFDGVYRRAGARPRRWVPVLNGCHSTQISKIDTFRRGRAPALRYERPFSVQPTDRKLAAGRRGHDPALRIVITSNSNLSSC